MTLVAEGASVRHYPFRLLLTAVVSLLPFVAPAMAQDWNAAGAEVWRATLERNPPLRDPFFNREVGSVAIRLLDAWEPAITGDDWQVAILERDEPVAFLLPGGRLGVSVGLFDLLENQDQLAGILAHEIAHLALRHTEARAERALATQLAGPGREIAALRRATFEQAAVPFTAQEEASADRLALEVLARAGFDPREALWLNEHLGEVEDTLGFARLHAKPTLRAAIIREAVGR